MYAGLEKWLNSVWYRRSTPPLLLRLLEPVYRHFSINARAQIRQGSNTLPLIVVGNITLGGTGKTPLVIALVKQFQALGLKPGVISHGYGRQAKGLHRVRAEDQAQQAGDECVLIKRETGVPVLVAEDRQLAIAAMAAEDVNLIIADDGLQSLGAQADLRLCVIDGQRLFGNGHLLPAGPLREPLGHLAACEYIVINGAEQQLLDFHARCRQEALSLTATVTAMQLQAAGLYRLSGAIELSNSAAAEDILDWQGKDVYAVAAIGNPQRFAQTLIELGLKPELLAFPDHHDFKAADFKALTDKAIIMTSKDAVKCARLGLENAWVLPVMAKLDAALFEGIIQHIRDPQRNTHPGHAAETGGPV